MIKLLNSDQFRHFIPQIIIALAALLLMTIWFWNGQIYASSESALPFENLGRYVELTKNAWSNYALGNYPGFTTASSLTYLVLYWVSLLGVPGFIIEAGFFYIIFLVSGIAIYQLTKELFPETKPVFLLLAVAYYWFNPFVLVNIWSRFLYNYMVFLALFPLVVWLFIKGLRVKKYIYSFYIGIASLVFSYASTSPPFDFLLWFVIAGVTVINFLWSKEKQEKIFVLKFLSLSLIIYVLFNIWWISQMFSYSASERFSPSSNIFFNSIDNLDTIQNISYRLGNLTDVFRLMHHDFYQNTEVPWIAFFSHTWQKLFEFGILFVVFLIAAVKFKKRAVLLCGLFILLGFFLMKGSSPPLGELTLGFFAQVPLLQLFRNPFEKFGFIVPVFLSPLIGYSFYYLFEKIAFLKKVSVLFLILFVVFFGKPFFTKELFTYQNNTGEWKSYAVSVPDYYQSANQWLKSQNGSFRIAAFPLGGEGITYNWNYPFSGVESTNTLLDIPAISYNTTIPYYSEISSKMEDDFLFDPAFFTKAGLLNIRYILIRDDIDFRDRQMMSPEVFKQKIKEFEEKGLLRPVQKFGKLSFWEINSWHDSSITINQTTDTVSPVQSFKLINQSSSSALLVDASVSDLVPEANINENIFLPNDQLSIESVITLGYERDQEIFPFVSYLPTHVIYPLVRLKEDLQLFILFNKKQKMQSELFFLGKRISEVELSRRPGNQMDFDKAISNYQKDFTSFMDEINTYSKKPDSQYQNWKSQYLHPILVRHQNYFSKLSFNTSITTEQNKKLDKLNEDIRKKLAENYIIPLKTNISKSSNHFDNWIIYKFNNLPKGDYRFTSANKFNGDKGDQFSYSYIVNGQSRTMFASITQDNRLDLGVISLEEGNNEIALQPMKSGEPVNIDKLPVNEKETFVNLTQYDPSTLFYLRFNYLLPDGSQLMTRQYGDNSVSRKGKEIYSNSVTVNFARENKNNLKEWTFRPGEDTNITKVGFILKNPSCQKNDLTDCQGTTLENVSITQYFQIEPVLIRENTNSENFGSKNIDYTKNNDSYYQLKFVNDQDFQILALNQLYHPGWQMKVNGKQVEDHFLVNSYANGWILKQKGELNIELEFIPDRSYKISQVIAGLSVAALSIFFFYRSWKARYGKN